MRTTVSLKSVWTIEQVPSQFWLQNSLKHTQGKKSDNLDPTKWLISSLIYAAVSIKRAINLRKLFPKFLSDIRFYSKIQKYLSTTRNFKMALGLKGSPTKWKE